MERPLFIYDGDCPFCCRWVARWRDATGDAVEYATSQDAAGRAPHVEGERFTRSSVFVEPDGRTTYGAEAALRAFSYAPRGGKLLRLYAHVPGFAPAAEAAYALVAGNRTLASRFTRLLYGRDVSRPRYALVRWAFLRGIGLTYLIAFLSLWVQADGLFSSRGILPTQPWLDAVAARLGPHPYMQVPTLFWISGSDAALHMVCAAGVVASLLLIANVLPGLAAVVAWACYLSLYVIGRVFLTFQWDILLLETGVIAALWAPWRLRPRMSEPVSRAPLWLARWLAARLMFLSGAVKLMSHDPAWRDFTAMSYHYETQPLPAWTSWYMHQLPLAFHKAETAMMFAIELGLPLLVFLPRRPRLVAFAGFIALQLMIGLTGNYGYFNILTAIICLSLLDDAYLAKVLPTRFGRASVDARPLARRGANAARTFVRASTGIAAAFLFALSMGNFTGRMLGYESVPVLVRRWLTATDQYQLTSNYGLFAVMTKDRPEIVVEGSDDGENWKAYEFRWKPGDVTRRPAFVQPHMPRLDWQMWFAALGNYRQTPWFTLFLDRLLNASPPVLALLAHDPFEGRAPRYVRATVYEYRFTRNGEDDSGAWWKRAEPRAYAPVMQRR